jgi:hypothetical protein
MDKPATEHRLIQTALAIPAVALLAAASYAVHGSIVATVFLYCSFCRRRHLTERPAAPNWDLCSVPGLSQLKVDLTSRHAVAPRG